MITHLENYVAGNAKLLPPELIEAAAFQASHPNAYVVTNATKASNNFNLNANDSVDLLLQRLKEIRDNG